MTEQHRLECLYRQIRDWDDDKRNRFFEMYTKINGAEKTEQLKQDARDFFRGIKK